MTSNLWVVGKKFFFWSFKRCLVASFTVLLFFAIPLGSLAIIAFFAPARIFVRVAARVFRPDLDSLVMKEHAMFATKTGPIATCNLMSLGALEGSHSIELHRKLFEERILNVQDGKTFPYDKLKKTWESFLFYAFWKIDQGFDLKNHIRDYDYQGDLALPNPCSEADLQGVAGKLINAPWNRDRSPWEGLVIRNYVAKGDESGRENGGKKEHTVIVFRWDHILFDGYSGMEIVRLYFQTELGMPPIKLGDTTGSSFWKKLRTVLSIPYHTAVNNVLILSAKKLQYLKKLDKTQMMFIKSPTVDVEVIKKIKNHFHVHYATVVYAAIFGALQRVLDNSGQAYPDSLAMGFVVPKPNHPKGLNIHAAIMAAKWPLRSASREERLQQIQKNFAALSHSTAAVSYVLGARLSAHAPIFLRRIGSMIATTFNTVSMACTNFPVTTNVHYFEGDRLTELSTAVGSSHSLGLTACVGGITNRQNFTFCIHKHMFASDEEVKKLGIYVAEELYRLLECTLA